MGHHHHTYAGPGTNVQPAIEYLVSKGATSPETAITLEEVESEEFKELIRLNAQTSHLVMITPEGKYWAKGNYYKNLKLATYVIMGFIGLVFLSMIITSFLSFGFFAGIFGIMGSVFVDFFDFIKSK